MPPRAKKGIPIERTYPGVMAWAPNSPVKFELDTNALVEELALQFGGTLTLADFTAAPTLRDEALENLIQQVRISGNAKVNGAKAVEFSAVDAAFLKYKTHVIAGTAPDRVDIGSANGVYDWYTTFSKFFGPKRIKGVGDATFLDTRKLQSLYLYFQTRDIGAMVKPGTGAGGGTAVLTNVQTTVHSREWQGAGDLGRAPYVKETQRSFDLTNVSGIDRDFKDIPIGNRIIRQTFKGCIGDVDYANPSDDFFTTTLRPEGAHVKTSVTGSGGTLTKNDITYDHLTAQNKTAFKMEDFPIGYATIEYAQRTGLLRDVLDLRGVLSAKNTLDVTPVAGQTNTLWITDEEVVNN